MSHSPNWGFSPSPFEEENRRDRMNVMFEDFIVGFIYGQITMFVIGVWSLLIGVITGILWWVGGQGIFGTKAWRRLGLPFVICLPFSLSHHVVGAVISFILQCSWQTVGYGEPSTQPPDAGSWLGRTFGIWTRPIWYAVLLITMIPLFL